MNIYEHPYADRYPELLSYLDPIIDGKEYEGMRSRRNVFSGNLIVGGPENPVLLRGGEHAQCVSINNFRTDRDPGFVNYEKENFNLKSDSEVFEKIKGFKPLPFDQMGLYKDQYRKVL